MNSLYFLLFFCINGQAQNLMNTVEVDTRFFDYENCLNPIAAGKLHSTHSNPTEYEKLNFQYNKMYEKVYPLAIFTPKSTEDVQAAVKCGVKFAIQLVPISGGHSYAGLSSGTNDSIVVDFRLMRNITINTNGTEVTVEPGTLIGHLYYKLWNNGRLGAALGSCLTVAVGGLAIGGGIGYFSTVYGLVIGNLVEINMVDSRGNTVRVDPTHNTDLWWAMRGVGPEYIGLVTSVKLKVFKAKELKLARLKMKFRNRSFKNVMASFTKWLDWVKNNDQTINSVITIRSEDYTSSAIERPADKGILLIILQTRDPEKRPAKDLDFVHAALNIFGDATEFTSSRLSFPSFIKFMKNASFIPVKGYNASATNAEKFEFFSSLTRERSEGQYHSARSFYVKKAYSAERFEEAQKVLLEIPQSGEILINTEQGAISHRQSNESAYVHRDALFGFKVYFETQNEEDVEASTNWMNKFYESVKFMDSGETFQNYPERTMDDYLERFYGANLERLVEIKRKYDPNHYFNSKMSLPINLV